MLCIKATKFIPLRSLFENPSTHLVTYTYKR